MKDREDTTVFNLLFANVSFKDILLKKELDELVDMYPHRLKVTYILDKVNQMPPPLYFVLFCFLWDRPEGRETKS